MDTSGSTKTGNPFATRLNEASVLMEETAHPELSAMLRLGAEEIARLARLVDIACVEYAMYHRMPTHRCKVCGALWRLYADPQDEGGSWSLRSPTCGKCCDNVAMGEQIVSLTDPAGWRNDGDCLSCTAGPACVALSNPPLPSEPEGWQPIETAPTDGRWFVGIYKSSKCPFVVRHDKDERMWCDTGDAYRNPTHWAALPETKEAKP